MAETKQGTASGVDTSGWDDVVALDPQENFDTIKSVYENLDNSDNANFRTQVRWDGDSFETGWQTVDTTTVNSGAQPSDSDYADDATVKKVRVQAQAAANTVDVRATLITSIAPS